MNQLGDDVIARAPAAILGHRHAVADQLGGRGLPGPAVLRIVVADHVVRPLEDLAPVLPAAPRRCGFHQTGAVRRSSTSSAPGIRAAQRSGSVKSKPGGMPGSAMTASTACAAPV